MNKKDAGSTVKDARHDLGMTQRELARRVGVRASHIAYIEANRRRPSLPLIRNLAEVLGVNARQLLLMSHPEAKILLGDPDESGKKGLNDAWQRFASNRLLHRRYRISAGELRVLKQVSLLQDVASPNHFLFILNSIRQAAASDD